jgi:hypothetical protein
MISRMSETMARHAKAVQKLHRAARRAAALFG